MSEPLGIQFACIGCGALNPAGAEVCSGCGHRFAGPDIVSTPPSTVSPPVRRPLTPDRFYEPPRTQIAPPHTFRIGTAMVFIAVIAIWMAAFATHVSLGVLATIGFLPATIRTFWVSARRDAEGKPLTLGQQAAMFVMTIWGVIVVLISSVIAFCGTCFPVGVGSNNLARALVVGGIAATGVAFLVGRALLRMARTSELEQDQIRWY